MRHVRRFGVVGVFLLAACGGGNSAPKERGLTSDEADRLASVLYTNHETGGATFSLATAFTATGDSLTMNGIVDWVKHQGHATVTASGQEQGIAEVFWNQSLVLERRPALAGPLAALGHEGAMFVARPIDTTKRQLDRSIGVLVGLASTVRDNGILIMQKEGSAFLRRDTWQGKPAEVLRYGTQNRYWLEPGTSILHRFDGNAAAGSAPIVIDLLSREPHTIKPPSPAQVLSVDAIKDLYAAVSGQ